MTPDEVLKDLLGFNYLTVDEAGLLSELARGMPPGSTVVNVGAGTGTSALALLVGNPEINLWTVDFALDVNPYGGIGNERIPLEKAGLYHELLADGRYHALQGDSREVARNWKYGPIHLLFIDDGHSFSEALGDLYFWGQHLTPGGIIAVHDYQKEESFRALNPDTAITAELLAHHIKPWPGVDWAVQVGLVENPDYLHVKTVDTLTAWKFTQ